MTTSSTSGSRRYLRGRWLLFGGLVAAVVATVAVPSAASAATRYVSMSSKYAADPSLHRYSATGNYYVYGTGGQGDGVMPIFQGSTPTKGFSQAGNIYRSGAKIVPVGHPASDVLHNFWAPDVVKRGSSYFAFFTATLPNAKPCVYWASAGSPTGPFSRPTTVVCGNSAGWEAIDPFVYQQNASTNYIVWRRGIVASTFPKGGQYEIRARKITFSGNRVSFTGGSNPSLLLARQTDQVMEAPDLIYRDGQLWLFVSRGGWDSNSYFTQVWSAKNITSPFHIAVPKLMSSGPTWGWGPGAAQLFLNPGTGGKAGTVYIAYESLPKSTPTPDPSSHRGTRFARVVWTNGKPAMATI